MTQNRPPAELPADEAAGQRDQNPRKHSGAEVSVTVRGAAMHHQVEHEDGDRSQLAEAGTGSRGQDKKKLGKICRRQQVRRSYVA